MITSADIRRILSKRQNDVPADDFRIIDSWVEYENNGFADKSSEKRKLNYMCYELEVLNPVTGEKEHLFKALKFCRVIRLPKSAKESKTFMDMHTQVLTGVWENQINFVTVIANIMEPVALGLLFLYGVQGIGRDIQEAKEVAHNDFLSFIGSLQGTYKVLELSTLTAEESEWLREKMYGMEYLTVVRGIPKAHNQGVDVSKSSGMDGKIANPEGQGTLEEIIIGMTDYEYVIEILSTPVYTDTLKHWSQRTESDMTDWYGQLQGTKGYSFNLSVPMMYLANQSTSSGWSQAYTDAESVSYTESETFSTAFGESAGTALSESYGTSIGHSEGISNSESVSFSSTTTTGETIGETVGTTIGDSVGTSQGISNGNTIGHSIGSGTSHTIGNSLGESFGTSHSVSVSEGNSETHSLGTSTSWSHSVGESFGESETSTEGFSQNQSFSRGESSGTSNNASFGASENWSEGNASGHSSGISTGASTSNSETTSDSISTSESTSQTHSDTHSNSTSVGNSVGTSHSDSQGASNTVTSGKTQGTSSGTNYSSSHTVTNGTSTTIGESHGTSSSTGLSNGTSSSTGTSDSAGTSDGWSQNSGTTQSTSSSNSVGTGTSHSSGSSDGGSVSTGTSDSAGSSVGGSTGTSSSHTQSTGQSGSTSQNTSTGSSSSSVTSQGNNTSVGASAMGINVGGSTSNSASNSQGASSSVGSGASQGSSTSIGTSEGVSSSTTATDSNSHSTTNSSSVSHTDSTTSGVSTSNSSTTGSSNSLSQTSGVSGSTNQSHSTNASSGSSQSTSQTMGTSQSTSHSTGTSQSISNGFSNGSSFTKSESVSSSESIGASINRGDTTSETSSITNGESTGSSDGYSVTQGESKGHTTGSSIGYGTSNSSSESFSDTTSSSKGGGYSTSIGSGTSQSVTASESEGFGSSSSTSFGRTHTTSTTDSVGGGTSESFSWGKSHTTGVSDGTSQSTSQSTSVSDGTSKNYSDSFSTSASNSSSTSQSHSVSQSNSSSVAHSNSLSNGTSRGTSTGNSISDSTSESKSHGTTESTGTSKTISNGTSKGTSKGISRGESIGTSGAYASGTASSMGLGPSIGYSKSYQWVDQQVKDIIELLEFQNQRIKKALRGEGAMYTYVYIACSSMDALSTAKATAKSAWQNEFALTNPLQVLDLTEQEQNHLLYHFSAFSSDVTRENVAGAQEYKYATVLLPGELTAYTHLPRISEGGIYANVEDIPKFAVPSMMRGEIYLGTVLSTERYSFNNGYSTPFDYKFDEASLMHGIFSGASRSGKTVAALRFAAELSRVRRKSTGKRLRLICMDPKTDWRALAHYVEPERFKFYSLGDINFHPIKLNPWKIPKGVWPQLWIDGVIDIYCRAYGLLERGKQMMGETIYALYEEAGVFKACDKEDWRETTPELSKQVTFAAIYARMSKIKLDLEDPNNKKGRAGNDTRDAYARLLDRLQAFGREFSIERRLFSSKDGMGVDDLIGEDDVVVLESSGLESTFSNFIFGVITSGFYKYAKAHEKGFLSKDQYETVFFIEEANKVLIGSDSADRSGGGNMGLSGQSEFEEILDQAAGWGLFIFAVTQLIAAMPSSVIANVGLLFAGRQGRVDDTTVVVRKIAREERIDDRDMVKWFPKAPIGWFVCQSTRGYNFKDAEPVLVKIAPLNNPSPTNDELDEILVQRKVIQAIQEAQ